MLDKILGVSPTQKGLAQDSKVADQKNLQPDFKKDFERQLQKKIDTKSKFSKENENNPKAREKEQLHDAKKNEDELRADHKQKKPSGGIKKKMVEPEEDSVISNVMALPKSEFEIPNQEKDLAQIESNRNSENLDAAEINAVGTKSPSGQSILIDESVSEKLQALGLNGDKSVPVDLLKEQPTVFEQPSGATAFKIEQPALQMDAQQTQLDMQKLSLEEQLGQDVDFQSDLKQHVAEAGLVQKMKEFETAKGLNAEVTLDFEQKVLQQLQQEKSVSAALDSQAKQNEGDSSSLFKDQDANALNDMPAEPLKPYANLHSGQMHTDFKAHLASPLEKAGAPISMEQLLEKRDENVQEVMKQAKYLAIQGGGEMTVKMSPDGMGEIQLKVLMQDGKLSIDMQTQDKSVKKLIEDSLSELKSGLAAQQVHVEHVKISTVNATNTDNTAQMHTNQDQSGAQQQQKDFWRNFQDHFGSQSRRTSYGDVAVVKSQALGEPAALQPIKINGARNYGRTGSTINRVA